MAGHSTIGLEILEDLPDVDTVFVPCKRTNRSGPVVETNHSAFRGGGVDRCGPLQTGLSQAMLLCKERSARGSLACRGIIPSGVSSPARFPSRGRALYTLCPAMWTRYLRTGIRLGGCRPWCDRIAVHAAHLLCSCSCYDRSAGGTGVVIPMVASARTDGGGGMSCGIGSVMKAARGASCKVYGCEPR